MSETDERDAFERLVDRVLAYRPKKKKKKSRAKQSKKQKESRRRGAE